MSNLSPPDADLVGDAIAHPINIAEFANDLKICHPCIPLCRASFESAKAANLGQNNAFSGILIGVLSSRLVEQIVQQY